MDPSIYITPLVSQQLTHELHVLGEETNYSLRVEGGVVKRCAPEEQVDEITKQVVCEFMRMKLKQAEEGRIPVDQLTALDRGFSLWNRTALGGDESALADRIAEATAALVRLEEDDWVTVYSDTETTPPETEPVHMAAVDLPSLEESAEDFRQTMGEFIAKMPSGSLFDEARLDGVLGDYLTLPSTLQAAPIEVHDRTSAVLENPRIVYLLFAINEQYVTEGTAPTKMERQILTDLILATSLVPTTSPTAFGVGSLDVMSPVDLEIFLTNALERDAPLTFLSERLAAQGKTADEYLHEDSLASRLYMIAGLAGAKDGSYSLFSRVDHAKLANSHLLGSMMLNRRNGPIAQLDSETGLMAALCQRVRQQVSTPQELIHVLDRLIDVALTNMDTLKQNSPDTATALAYPNQWLRGEFKLFRMGPPTVEEFFDGVLAEVTETRVRISEQLETHLHDVSADPALLSNIIDGWETAMQQLGMLIHTHRATPIEPISNDDPNGPAIAEVWQTRASATSATDTAAPTSILSVQDIDEVIARVLVGAEQETPAAAIAAYHSYFPDNLQAYQLLTPQLTGRIWSRIEAAGGGVLRFSESDAVYLEAIRNRAGDQIFICHDPKYDTPHVTTVAALEAVGLSRHPPIPDAPLSAFTTDQVTRHNAPVEILAEAADPIHFKAVLNPKDADGRRLPTDLDAITALTAPYRDALDRADDMTVVSRLTGWTDVIHRDGVAQYDAASSVRVTFPNARREEWGTRSEEYVVWDQFIKDASRGLAIDEQPIFGVVNSKHLALIACSDIHHRLNNHATAQKVFNICQQGFTSASTDTLAYLHDTSTAMSLSDNSRFSDPFVYNVNTSGTPNVNGLIRWQTARQDLGRMDFHLAETCVTLTPSLGTGAPDEDASLVIIQFANDPGPADTPATLSAML